MDRILIKADRTILIDNGFIKDPDGDDENSFVVDCKGSFILPGLIDFHVHVFRSGSEFAVPADCALIPQGITTAVDGGSAGSASLGAFVSSDILSNTVDIYPLINVSLMGQPTLKYGERLETRFLSVGEIKRAWKKSPVKPVGLKLRMGKESAEGLGIQPLLDSLKIAEELGCKLVVHSSDPEVGAEDIADLLRPGDIFCHCFHEKGPNILNDAGHVRPGILDARKRGVLFDAANGKSNFSFRIAKAAIADGFFPDIISTDLTCLTLYKDYAFGLPSVMSKYLALGMPLDKVIEAVTVTPASWLGMEDSIGTLKPGTIADVAVFDLVDKAVSFRDAKGDEVTGSKLLAARMTVKNGTIVYRQADFAL